MSDHRAHYERRTSADLQFYFVLVAANNEVVSVSEMYPTKQARDRGIAAHRRAALRAALPDGEDHPIVDPLDDPSKPIQAVLDDAD